MPDGKPKSSEKEYFAREEVEKLRKLALDRGRKQAEEEKVKLKELHWMHCPKCGNALDQITFKGIEIERCFDCGYTGLDDGELEKLAGQEKDGVVSAVMRIFTK